MGPCRIFYKEGKPKKSLPPPPYPLEEKGAPIERVFHKEKGRKKPPPPPHREKCPTPHKKNPGVGGASAYSCSPHLQAPMYIVTIVRTFYDIYYMFNMKRARYIFCRFVFSV